MPSLLTIPAREPVPIADGNILRRCRYATTREEYTALLNEVSPARTLLQGMTLTALERYVFNRVGPLFPTYNDVAQRDHFLPHTGLWAPVRLFDDPRIMTQLWLHTAAHEWYGWPLPVATTFNRYRQACFEGEVLAVLESEFNLFYLYEEETRGMFNPAYPSTYEALLAVGIDSPEAARRLLYRLQFDEDGAAMASLHQHPAFQGGVAATLHRQMAWRSHDETYVMKHWCAQRARPEYARAYLTLWQPDRQETIFARHRDGHEGILQYGATHPYDALEGARAVARSMLRVMALDVVQQDTVDQDAAFGRIAGIFSEVVESGDVDHLREVAHSLPDVYDDILGPDPKIFPAPIWSLALDFRNFRVQWEARLRSLVEARAASKE